MWLEVVFDAARVVWFVFTRNHKRGVKPANRSVAVIVRKNADQKHIEYTNIVLFAYNFTLFQVPLELVGCVLKSAALGTCSW